MLAIDFNSSQFNGANREYKQVYFDGRYSLVSACASCRVRGSRATIGADRRHQKMELDSQPMV